MINVSLAYENADLKRELPAVPRTGDHLSLTGTADEDHHVVEQVWWQFNDDGELEITLFIIDDRGGPALRPELEAQRASQTQW